MTTGQIARGGAFLRAARLIHRGRSDAEILADLRRNWLVGTDDQYNEIIRLAHMGVEAAEIASNLAPGAKLSEELIPQLPP